MKLLEDSTIYKEFAIIRDCLGANSGAGMTHLKHLKLLLLIFGGLLLALPQISHAKRSVWTDVSVEELTFIFRAEKLGLENVKARRFIRQNYSSFSFAAYGKNYGDSRYFMVAHDMATPGMAYTDPKQNFNNTYVKSRLIKNNDVTWGRVEQLSGPFGNPDINFLTINDIGPSKRHCIQWILIFGDSDWGDRYRDVIMALYCQGEALTSTLAKKIVYLLGYKGGYIPPIHSEIIFPNSQTSKSEYMNAKTIPNEDEGEEYKRGLAAYKKGDYKTALQIFEPLGEQGNASAKIYLGLIKGLPKEISTKQKYPNMHLISKTQANTRNNTELLKHRFREQTLYLFSP